MHYPINDLQFIATSDSISKANITGVSLPLFSVDCPSSPLSHTGHNLCLGLK